MDCKKCGAPAIEGAIFCGACGARLDGKKTCSFCDQLNDENNAYCVFCGARIDGKTVCSCGTAYSGAFCPQCGISNRGLKKHRTQTKKAVVKESFENNDGALCKEVKWRRVLDYVGSGIAMLGVLFALIFVFFIGVKAGGVGVIPEEEQTIFYYFGKYYREAKSLVHVGSSWFNKLMEENLVVYGVMGTVIGAVSLLSVITCGTVACIRFVRNMMGISEKKADGWALVTMFSFFIGASAFFALHSGGFTIDAYNAKEIQEELLEDLGLSALSVSFTTATKLGVIFCAIFAGAFVFCRLIVKGKSVFNASYIIKLIFATLAIALSAVVFCLVKNAGMVVEMRVFDDYAFQADAEIMFKVNYLDATSLMNMLCADVDTNYTKVTIALDTMRYSNTFAQISLFVALVGVGGAVCTNVNNTFKGRTFGGLTWAIVGLVGTIALLVCTLISYEQLARLFELFNFTAEEGFRMDTKLTSVICAVVFATLNLVATCVVCLFRKREKVEYIFGE